MAAGKQMRRGAKTGDCSRRVDQSVPADRMCDELVTLAWFARNTIG
jgi:hypothetical protein